MGLILSATCRTDETAQIRKMLDDRSKHIEFRGFLTNHEKHAIIALHGLNASPEYIAEWVKGYETDNPYHARLEPARKSQGEIHYGNWKNFLGKKVYFPDYVEFFEAEQKRLGLEKALAIYLPYLVRGAAGALLHGCVHAPPD